VYLDPGTVCAAIALPAAHPAASAPIPELYAPLLDGMGRACRALGVDADRDERTVRVGDRKVTGIAAHRGRDVTLVHGTLLVEADLEALRACLAGSRGGDLQGRPRPAASRPDHVTLVGGDAEAASAAVTAAFAAPDARLEVRVADGGGHLRRTRPAPDRQPQIGVRTGLAARHGLAYRRLQSIPTHRFRASFSHHAANLG